VPHFKSTKKIKSFIISIPPFPDKANDLQTQNGKLKTELEHSQEAERQAQQNVRRKLFLMM
jgi:hypothetical protein